MFRRFAQRAKVIVLIGGAALACNATVATADSVPITEPVIRGEMARVLRQAYDYEHRNSNNNVFRRSKHFSPFGNVFRSSQHYQQKLAASSDGYPLRTFVRYGRSVDGGESRLIEYNYAHHRRSPFGLPTIEEQGLEALVVGDEGGAVGWTGDDYYSVDRDWNEPHRTSRSFPPRERDFEDELYIESEPSVPTETAVLRTETRPDGSTHTVITSVPINANEKKGVEQASIDDAWALLNAGQHADAGDIFQRHTMNMERGAEAMAGYGISKLLSGDLKDARRAFDRAQRIDESVLSRLILDDTLRGRLESVRTETSDDDGLSAAIAALLD